MMKTGRYGGKVFNFHLQVFILFERKLHATFEIIDQVEKIQSFTPVEAVEIIFNVYFLPYS